MEVWHSVTPAGVLSAVPALCVSTVRFSSPAGLMSKTFWRNLFSLNLSPISQSFVILLWTWPYSSLIIKRSNLFFMGRKSLLSGNTSWTRPHEGRSIPISTASSAEFASEPVPRLRLMLNSWGLPCWPRSIGFYRTHAMRGTKKFCRRWMAREGFGAARPSSSVSGCAQNRVRPPTPS